MKIGHARRQNGCEGCEDGDPLLADAVTGLRYHVERDPIGGRSFNVVCTAQADLLQELLVVITETRTS